MRFLYSSPSIDLKTCCSETLCLWSFSPLCVYNNRYRCPLIFLSMAGFRIRSAGLMIIPGCSCIRVQSYSWLPLRITWGKDIWLISTSTIKIKRKQKREKEKEEREGGRKGYLVFEQKHCPLGCFWPKAECIREEYVDRILPRAVALLDSVSCSDSMLLRPRETTIIQA